MAVSRLETAMKSGEKRWEGKDHICSASVIMEIQSPSGICAQHPGNKRHTRGKNEANENEQDCNRIDLLLCVQTTTPDNIKSPQRKSPFETFYEQTDAIADEHGILRHNRATGRLDTFVVTDDTPNRPLLARGRCGCVLGVQHITTTTAGLVVALRLARDVVARAANLVVLLVADTTGVAQRQIGLNVTPQRGVGSAAARTRLGTTHAASGGAR